MNGETLLDALRAALRAHRNDDVVGQCARARIADLEQNGQITLLNNFTGEEDAKDAFGGELILYRKGFDVPAIEEMLDTTQKSFSIKQFQTDGKNKPVEGALYFVVIGDHLGVIASNSVTPRWLERYLTWLLKDVTTIIGGEDRIELSAKIEVTDGKKRSAAKAMTIQAESNGRDKGAGSKLRKHAKGKGGTVLDVLRLLGFGEDAIQAVEDDVPPGGRLEGDFKVFIKEGNKVKPLSVDTLDHAYRNLPPDQLAFDAKGQKGRGNMIQLSEPARIEQRGAVLDVKDALAKITDQLYRWNQNGEISMGPA
ncbi:hypothetical protein DM806_12850 [Sphingobium lactosutens]|nr:hypothetical protein [Sphingobium lactosutens]